MTLSYLCFLYEMCLGEKVREYVHLYLSPEVFPAPDISSSLLCCSEICSVIASLLSLVFVLLDTSVIQAFSWVFPFIYCSCPSSNFWSTMATVGLLAFYFPLSVNGVYLSF